MANQIKLEYIDSPTSKPFFLSSMMWRSKDHRSAGLWWSLLSSGGCLGGYGRLLKPFQPLIVAFVSARDTVDHSVTKSTVTSGQRR